MANETRNSKRDYRGVHRRQLFHWLATRADRENGLKKPLTDKARRQYIDYLRGSLEKGLWVKSPNVPEALRLRDFSQPLEKAIVCFTEWSLGESLEHTTEYGRLGLGFSKSWVLQHGGQPVTYFDHSGRSNFLRTLMRLLHQHRGDDSLDDLLYLAHFTKRIHKPTGGTVSRERKSRPRKRPLRRSRAAVRTPDPFERRFGKTMPYLEEREWRIVEHEQLVKSGVLVPNESSSSPEYFLPYKAGSELFTLVLPDSQTVSRVLQETWLTDRLFPGDAPHVSILSLKDIGTF